MGKLGRCMMSPLIARQYHSRAVKLTRTLRRCLVWWYSAVGALPPRVTPYVLIPPFGAHSDAQGLGHVACRVHLGSTSTCHTHLPPWFAKLAKEAEGESSIYLFEICAAILTVAVVSTSHSGSSRSCVLCIDNKAALAAPVKGSTSSELGTDSSEYFGPSRPVPRPIGGWSMSTLTRAMQITRRESVTNTHHRRVHFVEG